MYTTQYSSLCTLDCHWDFNPRQLLLWKKEQNFLGQPIVKKYLFHLIETKMRHRMACTLCTHHCTLFSV